MPGMDEYEPSLWTEDECDRLCGHCWAPSRTVGYENRRKCRHCGQEQEHVWVKVADADRKMPDRV